MVVVPVRTPASFTFQIPVVPRNLLDPAHVRDGQAVPKRYPRCSTVKPFLAFSSFSFCLTDNICSGNLLFTQIFNKYLHIPCKDSGFAPHLQHSWPYHHWGGVRGGCQNINNILYITCTSPFNNVTAQGK